MLIGMLCYPIVYMKETDKTPFSLHYRRDRSEHNNALFNTKLDQALCLPCPWKTKKEGGDEETSHRNGLMWPRAHTCIMFRLPFPPSAGKGSSCNQRGNQEPASISSVSNWRQVPCPFPLKMPPAVWSQRALYPHGSSQFLIQPQKFVKGGNSHCVIETRSKHTSLPRATYPASSLSPRQLWTR